MSTLAIEDITQTVTPIATDQKFTCKNCGGAQVYIPGTDSLGCSYCNQKEPIVPDPNLYIGEIDYEIFLESGAAFEQQQTISVVSCKSCGATSTLKPNVSADECPFCGASLVLQGGTQATLLKPHSLLPFAIDRKQGFAEFQKWVHQRWFAPNNLKQLAKVEEKLKGMYIPYFTFDSQTSTYYTGQRGDDYTTTETYTDSDGKRQTRSVTHTRWTSVSGHVALGFDDILVVASHSLPQKYVNALEPWDLPQLKPYDSRFLSGFQAETYQVELPTAFDEAKVVMVSRIRNAICQQIGGDHQRISSMDTTYQQVTFKHVLLPIWISSYRYQKKIYRFLVNGRTGEVQGERPYSWIKITLAVLVSLAIAGLIFFLYHYYQ